MEPNTRTVRAATPVDTGTVKALPPTVPSPQGVPLLLAEPPIAVGWNSSYESVFPAPPAPVIIARRPARPAPKFGPAFSETVELAPRVQATASEVLPVLAADAFATTGS